VDWINLAQEKGPMVSPCEHNNESLGSIRNDLTISAAINFSR